MPSSLAVHEGENPRTLSGMRPEGHPDRRLGMEAALDEVTENSLTREETTTMLSRRRKSLPITWAALALLVALPSLGATGFGGLNPAATPMADVPPPASQPAVLQFRGDRHPADRDQDRIEVETSPALPMETEHENGGIRPLWDGGTHDGITATCARQWGLSDYRANYMSGASHMPDVYDNEGTVPGTQQWRHGWVQLVNGIWIWGTADYWCNANVRGGGLNGENAFYYYSVGNRDWGDWYLGYASHYLEDVGNPWHTSANIVQQVSTHAGFELWVENNWASGWNLSQAIQNDWYYYGVNDPAAAVRALATQSNARNTTVYNDYVNAGQPTGAGTGSAQLVNDATLLLREDGRYVKGLIKFVLDSANAW